MRLVHAPQLYAALRSEGDFAGAQLNIEGAVVVGDSLRFFARGNGRATAAGSRVAATCDVSFAALLAHLADPLACDAPAPSRVVRYDLGELDGVRLGFTDAAVWNDAVLFSAAAEASKDAVEDGAVIGSVVGIIEHGGPARWARLTDERGRPVAGKIEGLLAPHDAAGHCHAVMDADDWTVPSMLSTLRLSGAWRPGS